MDLMPLNSENFGNPLELKPVRKIEPAARAKNEKQGKDQEKKQQSKKDEKPKPAPQPLPGGTIDLQS